ncbi:MAG: MFS transporter, partial [Anaerolineae bacterium]|nr:MFS transporter [Anaerolineae bacterium]
TEIARRRLDTRSQRAITRALIAAFAVMVTALLIFALVENVWVALIALWVATTLRGTAEPIVSTWTNQHIDSSVRATTLSGFGQVNAVGQIAGGPVIGVVGGALGLRTALSASVLLLAPVVWLIGRASRHAAPAPQVEVEAPVQ